MGFSPSALGPHQHLHSFWRQPREQHLLVTYMQVLCVRIQNMSTLPFIKSKVTFPHETLEVIQCSVRRIMALLHEEWHRVKVEWEATQERFKAPARDLCVAVTNLQAGALIRERRAEEGRHDAHHRLGHVALQDGVGVLAVACVVANLQNTKTTATGSIPVNFESELTTRLGGRWGSLTLQISTRKFSKSFHMWLEV